jgi:hypothetical protein
MTPCLASLAGPIKTTLSLGCGPVSSTDPTLQNLLHSIEPVAVSACTGLKSGTLNVIYMQLGTQDNAEQAFNGIVSDFKATASNWSQGGASGQYVQFKDSSGQPQLIWSYSSVPVIGAVTVMDSKHSTAAELESFWKSTVLPPA